jgi:hypothetical protein
VLVTSALMLSVYGIVGGTLLRPKPMQLPEPDAALMVEEPCPDPV